MTNTAASPYTRPIQIGSATLGGGFPFVLIAGPALINGGHGSGDLFSLADRLSAQTRELDVPLIFRIGMPRREDGLATAFEETLSILRGIRSRLAVPVAVDVHEPQQVAAAANVVDLLQIPAACCRQTDLLVEAARTGRPVNIEKDSLLPPGEAVNLLDKVASVGNWNVMLTECGTSSGHEHPVVDVRELMVMRESGFPLVFNAGPTPVAVSPESRSERRNAGELAETALAAGVDGIALLVEDDEKRDTASCTAGYSLAALSPLLRRLKEIERA